MKFKGWAIMLLTISAVIVMAIGCAPGGERTKAYRDGIFKGISQGGEHGYAEVTLTVSNDQIVDIKIVEYDGLGVDKIPEIYPVYVDDTWRPLLAEAHPTLADRIAGQNTWDVETVSGATLTSNRIKEATRFALEKAGIEPPEKEYFEGTFMAISNRNGNGWHIAWVTIEDDQIVDVRLEGVIAKKDNAGLLFDEAGRRLFEMKMGEYPFDYYHEARINLARKIIEAQSPEVDIFTGATNSSSDWMVAVDRALQAAKTK